METELLSGDLAVSLPVVKRTKITDDYRAKFRLWALNPQVVPAGPPTVIPGFKSRRFSSHAEMNAWKQSLIRVWAQNAPDHG